MKPADISGCISRHRVYTLQRFCHELQLGRAAWRALRRQGLPVHQIGKRTYISGESFMRWLDRQEREQ